MSFVYRFIDKDYNCLYVGFTDSKTPFRRLGEHFGNNGHLDSEAYSQVARIDVKEFSTKKEGLLAEKYYIKEYTPKYNEIYNNKNGFKKPAKIIYQEDWTTLTEFGKMEELPQFVKTLQWMYLGMTATFGVSTIIYMLMNFNGKII